MSYSVSGTMITLTRGDTFTALITITDSEGNQYVPVKGDRIGFAISSIIRRKHPVGFLRIDKSDPDGPYLFLELKKSVNEIIAQRTVLLEVKREDFISHK